MKKPCVFQRNRKVKDILYKENYPLFAKIKHLCGMLLSNNPLEVRKHLFC